MPDVAFVIEHPYIDALACFREPIKALADRGYNVDVYLRFTAWHPVPTFTSPRIRFIPIDLTYPGAAELVTRLIVRRPRYAVMFTVPQWSLHWTTVASRITGTPVAYISDELRTDETRQKARERREHQRCAFTVALSEDRAAYIRQLNRLSGDHAIYVVPNASPGASARAVSHYYQDLFGIDHERLVLLHAGSMGWSPIAGLARDAAAWGPDQPALVFQGRLPTEMTAFASRGSVWFSQTSLPADLLNYATSSAHIGLALYDDKKANDRLMGVASGKLCLYLRNALPVITTRLDCFEWVERECCGVRVGSVTEIPDAARAIAREYESYVGNVRRYYAEHLDFRRTFEPVALAVDRLAAR
ncbi:MAG TPA: hypothetical protein VFA43_10100 [Gemmatimonadaceae bacterium]|nr:hypothetical protein [Gemmatimonadaceae bacterium]